MTKEKPKSCRRTSHPTPGDRFRFRGHATGLILAEQGELPQIRRLEGLRMEASSPPGIDRAILAAIANQEVRVS